MGKYMRISERYKLEVLLKEKYKVKDIAIILDKSTATIYNEIKRGTVELMNTEFKKYKVYKADVAQKRYDSVKINKGLSNLKIANDYEFVQYVENKIVKEKYSPVAVLNDIKRKGLNFKTNICFKTLYNYIHSGLFLILSDKHLTVQKKKACKKFVRTNSLKNIKARLIDKRPKIVNKRKEFGHWEMDTVVSGHRHMDTLLVMTERKSRHELIFKLKNKSQAEVVRVLNSVEKKIGYKSFCNTFKTITMDNGTEFLDIKGIESSVTVPDAVRTVTYYCHPYCSSERGSNENANKLIRRFIPKGSDIGNWSKKQIRQIQHWVNDYPRMLFDGLSSNDVLKKDGIQIPSLVI